MNGEQKMTEYDNKLNDQIDKMYGAMGISKEAVSFGQIGRAHV